MSREEKSRDANPLIRRSRVSIDVDYLVELSTDSEAAFVIFAMLRLPRRLGGRTLHHEIRIAKGVCGRGRNGPSPKIVATLIQESMQNDLFEALAFWTKPPKSRRVLAKVGA